MFTDPQAAEGLAETLPAHRLAPLWKLYTQLVQREPLPSEPAHRWRWRDLAPLVDRAEHEVAGADADHRALILAHPGFAPRPKTTARLIAAVQCVRPGERTLEHRHSAAACRLVLEGDGATTFVDGRRCPMSRHDFIITPNWSWHAHANDSGSRAVWLDLLDVPLMGALDTPFGEPGPAPAYPPAPENADETLAEADAGADPRPGPPAVQLRWAWSDTLTALAQADEAPDGSRWLRITHPVSGGPVLATLDAAVLQLAGPRWTQWRRSSASAIAVVLEGEGESVVGETSFGWQPHDIFTLPHWQWHRHRAGAAATRLLVVSDAEALRRLGLLRHQHHTGDLP